MFLLVISIALIVAQELWCSPNKIYPQEDIRERYGIEINTIVTSLAIIIFIYWILGPCGQLIHSEEKVVNFENGDEKIILQYQEILFDEEKSFKETDSYYAKGDAKAYVASNTNYKVYVIEDPNCFKPRFVRYSVHGEFNFWGLNLLTYEEYVLYVPVGTITPTQIEAE